MIIERDNGYSAWLETNSLPVVHLEAGYSRGVHYALSAFSFRCRVEPRVSLPGSWGAVSRTSGFLPTIERQEYNSP